MEKVRTPVWYIEYGNRDITAYISPFVESVEYTDHVHGKADEIQIRIDDSDSLWKSSWYPSKGDALTLRIGYDGEPLVPCGAFEIDEIELSGPPDVLDLKGLAANIKKALRQHNTKAYEDKTLLEIAQEIATTHGFALIAEVEDIRVKRITQKQERDLSFLKRIADEYGYIFKITDNRLVFYQVGALEAKSTVYTIDRTDMLTFNFRDTTREKHKACTVSYHDPKNKDLIAYTELDGSVIKGDTLKTVLRCESKAQAIKKAKAHLKKKNTQKEGTIVLQGVPRLVAGSNIEVTGLFVMNGKYHILSSRHSMDRLNGYKTEIEVKRV